MTISLPLAHWKTGVLTDEPNHLTLRLADFGVTLTFARTDDYPIGQGGFLYLNINTEDAPVSHTNPDGTSRMYVELNEGPIYDGTPGEAGPWTVWVVKYDESLIDMLPGGVRWYTDPDDASAAAAELVKRGHPLDVSTFETWTDPKLCGGEDAMGIADLRALAGTPRPDHITKEIIAR